MSRVSGGRPGASRGQSGKRARGKTPAGRRARWIPEISRDGELFLRRAAGENGSNPDMRFPFSQGLTFVARRWRNLMNEELSAIGQSQARWGALYWIDMFGDTVNQTELAERIGVEQPTLGRVLDGLERDGLIERRIHERDQRARVIRLTAAARPALRQIARIGNAVSRKLLRDIDPQDLAGCVAVFAHILENFERH